MEFTATSLPAAIKTLFELNNYSVSGPQQVHGAEIDLVAHSLSDPFATPIYIEATIEHVDNDKYGRDVGKLAMIANLEPDAQKLIVSSKGFSLPVRERAEKSRIRTLTYDELFQRFEKFERYIERFSGTTDIALEIDTLVKVYEEPFFEDSSGKDPVLAYLDKWRLDSAKDRRWLVITGEYGTGKTALTKVVQRRWLIDYKANPSLPIPFRIELREFSRQFDAKGLLHHFLDSHGLGHISIDFVYSLVRSGRVVLLLDGYDEMAQYLHARERRACLEALAELAAGGARGVLTSRPNYFTEGEELQVFETLYKSFDVAKYHIGPESAALLERERQVDQLLEQFIDQFERVLKDLSPEQTERLIHRILADDVQGRDVVLQILKKVFRGLQGGDAVSLSGKPVIISYLVEVVEGLKENQPEVTDGLTEWQVYKLIVDQLMLRDLRRSPELLPERRRQFLQRLAMLVSRNASATVDEDDFKELIGREFKRELSRMSGDEKRLQLERYFADLRSSATLTRGADSSREGWRFSHNSLREYLVVEALLDGLIAGSMVQEQIPITDAMRIFVASQAAATRGEILERLATDWKTAAGRARGQLLSVCWEGLVPLFEAEDNPPMACLTSVAGNPPDLSNLQLTRMVLSTEGIGSALRRIDCSASTLADIDFSGADLESATFAKTTLENIVFSSCTLKDADFSGGLLIDVDLSDANVKGAHFEAVTATDISIVVKGTRLIGEAALGYLNFNGAITASLPALVVLRHHPDFDVVDKIIGKLGEQAKRQRRGLEQRGAAQKDIPLAREFVNYLENNGYIQGTAKKELVEVTEAGRHAFSEYTKGNVSEPIARFLRDRP